MTRLSETRWAILRRTQIGFVFQFFNLIANLTVADNIELPALLAGVAPARRARRAALLAELGLEDKAGVVRRGCPGVSNSASPSPARSSTARAAAGRRADRQPRQRRLARRADAAARAARRRPEPPAGYPRRARRQRGDRVITMRDGEIVDERRWRRDRRQRRAGRIDQPGGSPMRRPPRPVARPGRPAPSPGQADHRGRHDRRRDRRADAGVERAPRHDRSVAARLRRRNGAHVTISTGRPRRRSRSGSGRDVAGRRRSVGAVPEPWNLSLVRDGHVYDADVRPSRTTTRRGQPVGRSWRMAPGWGRGGRRGGRARSRGTSACVSVTACACLASMGFWSYRLSASPSNRGAVRTEPVGVCEAQRIGDAAARAVAVEREPVRAPDDAVTGCRTGAARG